MIFLIGTFCLYAFIHHQRHINFYTTGWDLAVFDQPVYLLSQGKTPFSSLHNTHTFGDHFHPLLLGFGALLYKIWADPRMLLWLEVAVAISSSYFLYLLSKALVKRWDQNESKILVITTAFSLTTMYVFSVGFQSMLLDDFHDDVLVTLPLIAIFYFLHTKKWLSYWISTIAILLTKEEYGLLVAAIGIMLLFRKIHRHGIVTIIIGITSFYLLLEIIMPRFATGTYWQYTYRHYSDTNQPSVVIKNFAANPQKFITTLIDHPEKRKTLITGTISFGLLPLAAPAFIIPIGETLLIRFIDATAPLRFSFNNHYNAPYIALLAVASAYGASITFKHLPKRYRMIVPIYILAATLAQDIIFHGPINSIIKPKFYDRPEWLEQAQALVQQVPQTSSLATQNFLLPHLSQRESFSLLPEIKNADYITALLVDHPTDFYGPPINKLKQQLLEATVSGQYHIYWQQNQALLLQKSTLK